MDPVRLAAAIRARSLELGFDRVGICDAVVPDEAARHFIAWLEAGHHAGMGWLERGRERRLDPQRVLKGARSFVVVALSYAAPDLPPLVEGRPRREAAGRPPAVHDAGTVSPTSAESTQAESDSTRRAAPGGPETHHAPGASIPPDPELRGFVARYARGDDYHDVMGERLARIEDFIEERAPGHRALAYVDTGPLLERLWAARAGIGWIGKNALVLNETMGSFFLLGLVITTVPLPPDSPATDRCGGCTRCLDACPTGAIVAPRVVDSRRCISYQTIEHRGPIPIADRPAIGTRLFGCDDCQEACPYNHQPGPAARLCGEPGQSEAGPASIAGSPVCAGGHPSGELLGLRPEASDASLIELLEMTPEEYLERFRGSAMKRATYAGLRRDAALALGHAAAERAPDSPARTRAAAMLSRIASDGKEDPIVRDQAGWSSGRLPARGDTQRR